MRRKFAFACLVVEVVGVCVGVASVGVIVVGLFLVPQLNQILVVVAVLVASTSKLAREELKNLHKTTSRRQTTFARKHLTIAEFLVVEMLLVVWLLVEKHPLRCTLDGRRSRLVSRRVDEINCIGQAPSIQFHSAALASCSVGGADASYASSFFSSSRMDATRIDFRPGLRLAPQRSYLDGSGAHLR